MPFLWLLQSSSSLLARALPTMGSVYSTHSEIQQDNWCHKQDQQCSWCSEKDNQQAEEPEVSHKKTRQETQQIWEPGAPLDGGNQWPPYSMWYPVAMILSAWALVEDWETMDVSLDSIEKMLQVVSSYLPNKVLLLAP